MNNLIISGYHATQDCVTVTAKRNGQLIQIPIQRKELDVWLYENDRLWAQTVHGWVELTTQEYWFERIVLGSEQLRDLGDYINVKGLAGDPLKDTFTALQSICDSYKENDTVTTTAPAPTPYRTKYAALEEQENEALNSEYNDYDFFMQQGSPIYLNQ